MPGSSGDGIATSRCPRAGCTAGDAGHRGPTWRRTSCSGRRRRGRPARLAARLRDGADRTVGVLDHLEALAAQPGDVFLAIERLVRIFGPRGLDPAAARQSGALQLAVVLTPAGPRRIAL